MKFSNSISKSHQTYASVFLAFSLFGFLLPHHGNEVKRHRLEVGLITGACAGFNTVFLCVSSSIQFAQKEAKIRAGANRGIIGLEDKRMY